MKRILTFITACCLLLVFNSVVVGQNAKLRYSNKQFELSNLMEAAKGYQKAYEKKATYRAAKGAAVSYKMLSSYEEANKWWKKTVEFEESTPDDFSNYIFSTHQVGSLNEVKAAIENASPKWHSPKANFNLDSLTSWYSHQKNVQLVSLDALNSSSADYGISFDKDGNSYFSSDRGPVSSSGKKSIRVDGVNKFNTKKYDMTGRDFISIYKGDGKNQILPIQSLVPNTFHFADPYMMKEKPIIFYTLTRDIGKVKGKRNFDIYPEVYYSTINENAELLDYNPFPINSALEHGVINPIVDEEEKKIYFSSNRSGGLGGYDLYYVTYDDNFNFGSPVNLGPAINTGGDERDPFRSGDSFYFSSNGQVGLGGLDIFHADYGKGDFTDVRNMGLPHNSPQDDFAMRRTDEGMSYLTSNRGSSTGLDDMYQIEDLYRQFVGKVIDCEGNLIGDGLEVEMMQKDTQLAIKTEQEKKGIIKADIAPDADFHLSLKKQGYFTLNDPDLTTKDFEGEQLEKEYVLKKVPYKAMVSEYQIYYNYGQSVLRADTEPTMEKIAVLMKNHTFLEVLVRSHTDSRSSKKFNNALSERRANAVRDYLEDYGIARSRVGSEWFGEEQLINDCGDGVPCPESAHQLNRRSELILIAFPDENKIYEYPPELEGADLSQLRELKLPGDCR